jgi:hypothetical protein
MTSARNMRSRSGTKAIDCGARARAWIGIGMLVLRAAEEPTETTREHG